MYTTCSPAYLQNYQPVFGKQMIKGWIGEPDKPVSKAQYIEALKKKRLDEAETIAEMVFASPETIKRFNNTRPKHVIPFVSGNQEFKLVLFQKRDSENYRGFGNDAILIERRHGESQYDWYALATARLDFYRTRDIIPDNLNFNYNGSGCRDSSKASVNGFPYPYCGQHFTSNNTFRLLSRKESNRA